MKYFKHLPQIFFKTGLIVTIISAAAVAVNHEGISLKLLNFAYLTLITGTVLFITDLKNK